MKRFIKLVEKEKFFFLLRNDGVEGKFNWIRIYLIFSGVEVKVDT